MPEYKEAFVPERIEMILKVDFNPQMNPVNEGDILNLIKENPEITKEEIAIALGISVSTVKRRLNELIRF